MSHLGSPVARRPAGQACVSGTLLAIPVDFAIARARIRFSHHVLIEVEAGGARGAGEGVLYRSTLRDVARLFARDVRPALEGGLALAEGPVQEAWLARLALAEPGLAYAVDSALLDLRGALEGRTVAALLGGVRRTRIPITEQIFIRSWRDAERELAALPGRGTRRLKVKVGTNPRADLETVRRIRAFVGDAVELRVDANRAYGLAESEALYRGLAGLGVLALEEPLAGRDWAGLRALRERVGLPVILDENILSLDDLRAAIGARALDILNIKLTRVGGPRLALGFARLCREHGIGTALGCTEDLGLGTAAILHTAAALEALHSVEGLGPQRLGFDVVDRAWPLVGGALDVPGLGAPDAAGGASGETPGPPAGATVGLGVGLLSDWRAHLPRHVRVFEMPGGLGLAAFSHYARLFQRANSVLWRVGRGRH